MDKRKVGSITLAALGAISIVTLLLLDPITQDETYHNFSDQESFFGVPNFWNVISNLPFLIVGIYGLLRLKKIKQVNFQYITFFIGISLVSLGSGYYHLFPNSTTLIWDRLPMTLAFTGLMSIIISEFINKSIGKKLFLPLISAGLVSILYWVYLGDLRPYVLVQFYPLLAIPIILTLFKKETKTTKGYWLLLSAYIIAKVFETFDYQIHEIIHVISGHSLKHMSAAIGIYVWLKHQKQKA